MTMISNSTADPKRRFVVALYEIAGDNARRLTPFGEVAQQAGLSDSEAHGAFARLREEQCVTSNSAGCVALTDAGRKAARSPARRKAAMPVPAE